MARRKSELRRKLERPIMRWTGQALAALCRALPMRWAQRVGDMWGWFAFVAVPKRQRLADRNMALCFGDRLTPAERKRIRYFATRNLFKTMLELFRLPAMTEQDFNEVITFENPEIIAEALALGKGAIIITAHYGNWELMAASLARLGLDLHVVARDSHDPQTAQLINESRESAGMTVIERDDVRAMMRVVRSGGVLGILPDQRAKKGGVWLDFMGRPASTFTGPATFAIRTNMPVVPCFGRRTDDDRIIVTAHEPLDMPDTGDREADIIAGTQPINDTLGREIMRRPAQWLWLHDRWREPPPEIAAQWAEREKS